MSMGKPRLYKGNALLTLVYELSDIHLIVVFPISPLLLLVPIYPPRLLCSITLITLRSAAAAAPAVVPGSPR